MEGRRREPHVGRRGEGIHDVRIREVCGRRSCKGGRRKPILWVLIVARVWRERVVEPRVRGEVKEKWVSGERVRARVKG